MQIIKNEHKLSRIILKIMNLKEGVGIDHRNKGNWIKVMHLPTVANLSKS